MVFTTYTTTFLPYFSPHQPRLIHEHQPYQPIIPKYSKCVLPKHHKIYHEERRDMIEMTISQMALPKALPECIKHLQWCTRGNMWHGLWTLSAGHAMCWVSFILLRPQILYSFEQISMDSSKVVLLIIGSQDSPRIEILRCRGSSDLLAWQPTWEQ